MTSLLHSTHKCAHSLDSLFHMLTPFSFTSVLLFHMQLRLDFNLKTVFQRVQSLCPEIIIPALIIPLYIHSQPQEFRGLGICKKRRRQIPTKPGYAQHGNQCFNVQYILQPMRWFRKLQAPASKSGISQQSWNTHPANFCGRLHRVSLCPTGTFFFLSTTLFRTSSATFVYNSTLFPLPNTESMVHNQDCQELCHYPIFHFILSRQCCRWYASSAVIEVPLRTLYSAVSVHLWRFLRTNYFIDCGYNFWTKSYDRLLICALLHFQCAMYHVLIASMSGALSPLATEAYPYFSEQVISCREQVNFSDAFHAINVIFCDVKAWGLILHWKTWRLFGSFSDMWRTTFQSKMWVARVVSLAFIVLTEM